MSPSRFLRLLVLVPTLFAVLSAQVAIDRNYRTTRVMRDEVRTLVQMLEYFHYNKDAVSSSDYIQLVSDYMADLDPQHMFFTASDEKAFRELYGPRIENDLEYLGNIDAAFDIFRVYEERVQERAGWLFERLTADVDLASNEVYYTDRQKSPWPANREEANDLWERRIKFELIQEMLQEKSFDDAKQTVRKRYERMLKNIAEIEAFEVQETYLSSLTRMYDPHSSYFSADTLEDFSIQMKLSLVGIGAVLGLDDDGYCVVREVVPGGPAFLSGQIKVNDKIIAVQQEGGESVEVIGMKLRRIVDMIRGQKDTKVYLKVLPRDAASGVETTNVLITRDLIKLNSARATAAIYDVPGAEGETVHVGVISLNSFYGPSDEGSGDEPRNTVSQDVAELVEKLKSENIEALVIDLRRNGGGLLSEAIKMTGLFISQGPVVQVRDSLGRLTIDSDTSDAIAYNGPLAVLTSRFSASASEIFAGALQNYGRAVIVGDSSTHGKGTVQAVLEMKNYLSRGVPDNTKLGAAKLTIQKFYLPNGASTQKKGVVPDIALPSIDDLLPIGEADLPHALVWDEIKSAPFQGEPLAKSFVQPLLQASLERQNQLDEFAFLKREIDRFKERRDLRKVVSLNLDVRREQKKADDESRKLMDEERERLAKSNFTHREIKLDSVIASDGSTPAETPALDEGDTDAEDEETRARLDVHLRESLRVVTDALRMTSDPELSTAGRGPVAAEVAGSNKS